MKDNRKNPWYYLLLVTLGIIVGSAAGYYIAGTPKTGGALVTVVVLGLFLWKGGPQKPAA